MEKIKFHNFSKIIILLIILILASCREETERTISFEESYSKVEDSVLMEFNLVKASSKNEPFSSLINKTIEDSIVRILYQAKRKSNNKTIDDAIISFKREYAHFKSEFNDPEVHFECTFDTEVLYQSDEILTIALTSYFNLGGAHGNSYISILNFDKQTQSLINSNLELLDNSDEFKVRFNKSFKEKLTKQLESEVEIESTCISLPNQIGLNYEGVLFIYNAYEIDIIGSELFEFVIPYNEIEKSLNYH